MSALEVKKIGPFPIKRKVGKVAFELDLPEYLKIHPIISCVHLEPTLPEHPDSQTPPPPLTVEGEEGTFLTILYAKSNGVGLGMGLAKPIIVCGGKAMVQVRMLGNRQTSSSSRYRSYYVSLKLRLIVVREAPDLLAYFYVLVEV